MGWKTAAFGLSGYNAEKGARGGGMSLGDPVYPEQKTFYEYFRPGTYENPGWVGITNPLQSKVTTKSNVPVYPEAGMGGGEQGSGLGRMIGSLGGMALGTVLGGPIGGAAGASLGGELGGMAEGGDFDVGRAGMNFGLGALTGGMGGGAKSAAPSLASQGYTELTGPAVNISDPLLGGPPANTGRAGLRDMFAGMNSAGYSPEANASFANNGYLTNVRNRASGMWNGGTYGYDWNQGAQTWWPSAANSGAY